MGAANRNKGSQITTEYRYFISLPKWAQMPLEAVRFLRMQNFKHWTPKIAFREGHRRIPTGQVSQNIAILRHLAVNMPRLEQSTIGSIIAECKIAGRNEVTPLRVLTQNNHTVLPPQRFRS